MQRALVSVGLALVLAGCGGGSEPTASEPTRTPTPSPTPTNQFAPINGPAAGCQAYYEFNQLLTEGSVDTAAKLKSTLRDLRDAAVDRDPFLARHIQGTLEAASPRDDARAILERCVGHKWLTREDVEYINRMYEEYARQNS